MDSLKHRKEKTEMILEPMQVMIQLALLSFCPLGTKISVSSNILYLQLPTFYQGAVRWYQNDTKDDLHYLFHVMRRYYKWYNKEENKIFGFILEHAKKGIESLIATYNKTEQNSILHTLSMYKNILKAEDPKLFDDENENSISIDTVFEKIKETYDKKYFVMIFSSLTLIEEDTNQENQIKMINGLNYFIQPQNDKIHKWIQERLTM